MSTEQTNPRDVIAQALALSEAATDGPWHCDGLDANGAYFVRTGDAGLIRRDPGFVIAENAIEEDAAFTAAARTLLPAFAKALGDVLAVVESSEMSDGPYRNVLHTTAIRRAITAALSEVTP